jgi:3',5'-cyclic AMP phosphodiesterase CpdA
VSFTLAHLSDVHLAHVPRGDVLSNFQIKRIIGGASWFFRRSRVHRLLIANAIRQSILDARTDHVALTGDLVNIAGWHEFPKAAQWLKDFALPDKLSFIPGNHDTYVEVPWKKGLEFLAPWMQPDVLSKDPDTLHFPYLRLRRNVALIGLNSGSPQKLHRASGTLGEQQRRDLKLLLDHLGQQGFFRIVMIHHPPLPGLATPRKALTDAAALADVLQGSGCELVLHGHNHTATLNWHGSIPVVGVPSASLQGDIRHEAAGWNHYTIRRNLGRWTTELTPYRWNDGEQQVNRQATIMLLPPS